MPAYGSSAAGFVSKPLSAILSDMQNDVLATIDPAFDLSPDTPDGQMLGIVANQAAQGWELAQIAYNQFNREDVEGAGLDNIGDLTGSPRESGSFSQVYMNLTVDPGSFTAFPYASGSLLFNVAGSSSFTFTNAATITSAMLAGSTLANILFQASTIGPTSTVNPGTLTVITTPVTGLLSGTNPEGLSQMGNDAELDTAYAPRQEADLAAEGSCTMNATAAALNKLGAAQTPPVTLIVNVLENPENFSQVLDGVTVPAHRYAPYVYAPTNPDWLFVPLGGTAHVINGSATVTFSAPQSLAFGQLLSFDSQPDISYYAAAATSSSTTCTLTTEYNGTTTVAANATQLGIGAPLIAQVIYDNKPAGIKSFGTTGVDIDDPIFGPQLQSYSIPTEVPVYFAIQVAVRTGVTFSTVQAAIAAAMVAAAVAPTPGSGVPPVGQLAPGASVIGSQFTAICQNVPGVVDVQVMKFDITPSPTNTAPLSFPATQVPTIPADLSTLTITQGTLP